MKRGHPRSLSMRHRLKRYAVLCQGLLYTQICGEKKREEILSLLRACDLITSEETKALEDCPAKINAVAQWMSAVLSDSVGCGLIIEPVETSTLLLQSNHLCPLDSDKQDAISGLRGACADVMMHAQTQIPYPYVHVVVLLVNLNCLLLCVITGTVIGTGFYSAEKFEIAIGYILLIFSTTAFQVVIEIVRIIQNPFNDECNNFPTDLYLYNTISSCDWLQSKPIEAPMTT
jgi:hypothetical protein